MVGKHVGLDHERDIRILRPQLTYATKLGQVL